MDRLDVVVHAMFDAEGILPCCGLSRYAVRQTDRVSLDPEGKEVTCTGKKRINNRR